MRIFRENQICKKTIKRKLNLLSIFFKRTTVIWFLVCGFGFFHTPTISLLDRA